MILLLPEHDHWLKRVLRLKFSAVHLKNLNIVVYWIQGPLRKWEWKGSVVGKYVMDNKLFFYLLWSDLSICPSERLCFGFATEINLNWFVSIHWWSNNLAIHLTNFPFQIYLNNYIWSYWCSKYISMFFLDPNMICSFIKFLIT